MKGGANLSSAAPAAAAGGLDDPISYFARLLSAGLSSLGNLTSAGLASSSLASGTSSTCDCDPCVVQRNGVTAPQGVKCRVIQVATPWTRDHHHHHHVTAASSGGSSSASGGAGGGDSIQVALTPILTDFDNGGKLRLPEDSIPMQCQRLLRSTFGARIIRGRAWNGPLLASANSSKVFALNPLLSEGYGHPESTSAGQLLLSAASNALTGALSLNLSPAVASLDDRILPVYVSLPIPDPPTEPLRPNSRHSWLTLWVPYASRSFSTPPMIASLARRIIEGGGQQAAVGSALRKRKTGASAKGKKKRDAAAGDKGSGAGAKDDGGGDDDDDHDDDDVSAYFDDGINGDDPFLPYSLDIVTDDKGKVSFQPTPMDITAFSLASPLAPPAIYHDSVWRSQRALALQAQTLDAGVLTPLANTLSLAARMAIPPSGLVRARAPHTLGEVVTLIALNDPKAWARVKQALLMQQHHQQQQQQQQQAGGKEKDGSKGDSSSKYALVPASSSASKKGNDGNGGSGGNSGRGSSNAELWGLTLRREAPEEAGGAAGGKVDFPDLPALPLLPSSSSSSSSSSSARSPSSPQQREAIASLSALFMYSLSLAMSHHLGTTIAGCCSASSANSGSNTMHGLPPSMAELLKQLKTATTAAPAGSSTCNAFAGDMWRLVTLALQSMMLALSSSVVMSCPSSTATAAPKDKDGASGSNGSGSGSGGRSSPSGKAGDHHHEDSLRPKATTANAITSTAGSNAGGKGGHQPPLPPGSPPSSSSIADELATLAGAGNWTTNAIDEDGTEVHFTLGNRLVRRPLDEEAISAFVFALAALSCDESGDDGSDTLFVSKRLRSPSYSSGSGEAMAGPTGTGSTTPTPPPPTQPHACVGTQLATVRPLTEYPLQPTYSPPCFFTDGSGGGGGGGGVGGVGGQEHGAGAATEGTAAAAEGGAPFSSLLTSTGAGSGGHHSSLSPSSGPSAILASVLNLAKAPVGSVVSPSICTWNHPTYEEIHGCLAYGGASSASPEPLTEATPSSSSSSSSKGKDKGDKEEKNVALGGASSSSSLASPPTTTAGHNRYNPWRPAVRVAAVISAALAVQKGLIAGLEAWHPCSKQQYEEAVAAFPEGLYYCTTATPSSSSSPASSSSTTSPASKSAGSSTSSTSSNGTFTASSPAAPSSSSAASSHSHYRISRPLVEQIVRSTARIMLLFCRRSAALFTRLWPSFPSLYVDGAVCNKATYSMHQQHYQHQQRQQQQQQQQKTKRLSSGDGSSKPSSSAVTTPSKTESPAKPDVPASSAAAIEELAASSDIWEQTLAARNEVLQVSQRMEALLAVHNQALSEWNSLQHQTEKALEENNAVCAKLDFIESRSDLASARLTQLEETLKKADTGLTKLKDVAKEAKALKTRASTVDTERNKLLSERDKDAKALQVAKGQIGSLEAEKRRLEAELEDLKAELASLEAKDTSAQQAVVFKSESERLKQQFKAVQESEKQAFAKANAAEKEASNLRQELAKFKRERDQAESSLNTTLATTTSSHAESAAAEETIRKEALAWQALLEAENAGLKDLAKQTAAAVEEAAVMQAAMAATNEQILVFRELGARLSEARDSALAACLPIPSAANPLGLAGGLQPAGLPFPLPLGLAGLPPLPGVPPLAGVPPQQQQALLMMMLAAAQGQAAGQGSNPRMPTPQQLAIGAGIAAVAGYMIIRHEQNKNALDKASDSFSKSRADVNRSMAGSSIDAMKEDAKSGYYGAKKEMQK